MLIIECCGCENLELVQMTSFSEDVEYFDEPQAGEADSEGKWDEVIYPPARIGVPGFIPKWRKGWDSNPR